MIKLSVIIVNYNVKHFVEQCLHSAIKASQNCSTEIFVVDNNSVDGSVELIKEKFPSITLIENKVNTGFSVANNQAIKISKGEYVLLLNPDTVVEEDTFEKVIAFMDAHPDAGGLGVKMLDGKGNFLPESKRGLPTPSVAFYKIFGLAKLFPKSKKFGQYHLTFLDKEKTHEIDILSGAFMLMRKTALDKVGLLDETFFMYGEDIDLSYRITQGGFKNYYFPETKIIHYKGESTKKSSVNYVLVFYKAMVIFAEKHFSKSNAKTFSFLIHIAIYLRAGAAILARFLKKLALPLFDFGLILFGLFILKNLYASKIYNEGTYYSDNILKIAFPIYTSIWMLLTYLSGGYDYPIKLWRIVRGLIVGTGVILIGYSLLPEAYRFSRALILLGFSWATIVYLTSRISLSLSGIKKFSLSKKPNKRIAIIGDKTEFTRVNELLKVTEANAEFIGFVNSQNTKESDSIGNLEQIQEIISIYKITEVIFCAKEIPSKDIINYMLTLVSENVDFKIAPPESLSIIGSNSIDTAGDDLYIIDINSISKPKNKRNKRLLDFGLAGFFLILSPLLIFIMKNKLKFIKNSFSVLFGLKTWVGYLNNTSKDLPKLKNAVLSPATNSAGTLSNEAIKRINLIYSKNYLIENDFSIIFKNLRYLGN